MPKAQLTAAYIATLECPPGKTKVEAFDTLIPGFTFERRASGHGTYYLRHSIAGRQKQLKICCEKDAPIAQVRKKAQQLRSEVTLGGNPSANKAKAKATPTFGDIAANHIGYAKLHLKSYEDVESTYRVHISPKWGKVRVDEITRQAVAQWLAEKRASGLSLATVEKLRVTMGRAYELANQENTLGCDKNPTRGLPRKPLNNARDRFLTEAEATRLKEAAADSNNPQLKHIVGLLLLTGVRMRELLDARWEHVDVERRQWFIPTSKTGRSRYVPLATPAVAIMAEMPRFKNCPYVVPNPETLKPFVSLKNGWKKAIKAAHLPGLRIHDLRHSAASFMAAAGVDIFTIGKVLGHASYQSTQRYSHLAQDTLLKAVEAGAAKHTAND